MSSFVAPCDYQNESRQKKKYGSCGKKCKSLQSLIPCLHLLCSVFFLIKGPFILLENQCVDYEAHPSEIERAKSKNDQLSCVSVGISLSCPVFRCRLCPSRVLIEQGNGNMLLTSEVCDPGAHLEWNRVFNRSEAGDGSHAQPRSRLRYTDDVFICASFFLFFR